MRLLASACLLLLASSSALAVGEEVDIVEVRAPERTMGGKVFAVEVDLANKGPERRVYLFAALYDGERGDNPCGPITDPRFIAWTPLYQGVLTLPANARATFPPAGETWRHRYDAADVAPQETTDEFCVFVGEREQASAIDWLDFDAQPMRTRGANAAPTGAFTWAPETPRAAQDVRFEATGEDADGDALTYAWDFGHANASGRARAEGPVAFHPFYPDGTFTVTLTISDGFDDTLVTRDVRVLVADDAAATPPGPVVTQEDNRTPMSVILAPLAALAAAWLRPRSTPRDRCPPARSRRRQG